MSTFPDTLQDLFRPQPDALTLYTNKRSPCARRVRIALEEKGIPYHLVEVDLDNRYNHSPAYLEINPQGKVPAIALRRFRGLEDVSLYESNALTEWADEQFTDDGPQLYPSNRLERFQAKQWQEWESRMAEDFWRVIYANSRGFMMRLRHNETSYRELLDTRYPERPDLRQKLWKTYDGSLLSRSETVRRIKNIYRAFDRIEQHLSTCPVAEDGKRYLVGGRFTIADVSVLPRIAIAPFAGMLSSRWEKSEYPLLTQYVRDLGERPSFAASSDSGRLVRAIASWIPWGLIQWLGNWRSGRELEHINGETVLRELRQQCPAQRDVRVASVEQATLYLPEKGPRAKAARLALGILNPKLCIVRTLSDLSLRGRGIELRNVQNIIEFMDTAPDGELSCLIPDAPLQRCQVRMLHGMFETCLSYHYEPLVNGKELKAEEIEAYQTGLRQQLLFLEERLKQGRYLVGNGLTSADLAFYSLVQSLAELKVPIPLGDFPELLNWMTRLAPLAVLATQSS